MTRFVKMHASGNDYVYIPIVGKVTAFSEPDRDWVKRICDRHMGVGADGVVYLIVGEQYRMVMYNADGSRGRICGNALRSIGALLDEEYNAAFPLVIATDAGLVCLSKIAGEQGGLYAVDMGVAKLMGIADRESAYPLHLVDVGNRHAVCMAEADMLAKVAERARLACAYEGLNVETYQVIDNRTLALQVNEYGTGRTMACGSGACAVCFAACHSGCCTFGLPIKVRMDGGEVAVVCHKDGAVTLIGDAHIVFRGEYID